MTHRLLFPAFTIATLLGWSSLSQAHSGVTFIADAVEKKINIDGDLSDWPTTREYKLSVPYLFDGEPDTADFTGRFRLACDYDREILYVGVEVTDDTINLDSQADMWNSRDICEIFLALEHTRKQSVPLQFVYRKRPTVAEADEPNRDLRETFTAVRRQLGNQLTYEWRIHLASLPSGKGCTKRPAVFGFDVGYVDLDEEGDVAVFSSSPGQGKHLTSATLGDLILPTRSGSLVEVAGRVVWPPQTAVANSADSTKRRFPPVAIKSDEPGFYVQVPCNDSGHYRANLPPGKYTASVVDTLAVRVSEIDTIELQAKAGTGAITLPNLHLHPLPKPDLIDKTGLMHRNVFEPTEVDEFVNSYMQYHKIPGLSLAIVKNGEVVYGKGFGVKSLVTNEPINDSTVFEVASLTKPMFAYAVCRLVERGVIDLDTPLCQYLPYEDIQHDDRYKKITGRMVLCHRTGFPNWRDGQLKIHFDPGSQQRYSGEAFGYLANVVSHLTDNDIENLMDAEVFAPLGIENTFLTWPDDADDSLVAMPHDGNNTALRKLRWDTPWVAGCLHVDAANFAKFIQGIIKNEGMSTEGYAEMLRPQVEIPEDSDDQNFSLGFLVSDSDFGKVYSHGGHNTGFTSAFEIYKDAKFGYVFMVNNYQAPKFHDDLKAFLVTGRNPTPRLTRANDRATSSLVSDD